MKRKAAVALLALATLAVTLPASAHRIQRENELHPLRLVGYGMNAIGMALEYAIARPIHWIVSRDHLDIVFGHKAYVSDDEYYFEWTHGDYSPSIAVERQKRREAGRETAAPN